jgi:competence protein ComEA
MAILYFKFYYQPVLPSSEKFVKEIVVEVLGDVKNPGVYLFQNPPILKEAIDKAGGLKETALFDKTLSSEILETGTLLTVVKEPSRILFSPKGDRGRKKQEEVKIRISRMAANKLLVFSIPLDLNRVSMEDLCLIPGIGEPLAQEIIAFRRKRGFRSVEELKKVRGIGEKKYQDLKEFFIIKK